MHTSICALLLTAFASYSAQVKTGEPATVDGAVAQLVAGINLVTLARTCGWTADQELLQKAKNTVVVVAMVGLPLKQRAEALLRLVDPKSDLVGMAEGFAREQAKAGGCSSKAANALWTDLLRNADILFPPVDQPATPGSGKP